MGVGVVGACSVSFSVIEWLLWSIVVNILNNCLTMACMRTACGLYVVYCMQYEWARRARAQYVR